MLRREGSGALSDIRFYHLQTTTLERALPLLLEKVLERGERAVVRAGSSERVEALNAALWTYDDRSFLPHGSARDGSAPDQPVWLTTEAENPNGARVLVLTDGATADAPEQWTMILEVFDGRDGEAVAAARSRWVQHRAAGHTLAYWKQNEAGQWEKS